MITVSLKDMFDVGAHFGHQTHRWNPKMKPYIFGERHGIHIINLQRTVALFRNALEFVVETVADGGDLLFVGTKKQARDVVADQATRCHMHYVNDRWMGGTLTNFKTIKSSIDKLVEMEEKREKGEYASLTKKERINIDRAVVKLSAALGGIRLLGGAPSVMVVIDPKVERIAIHEAKILGLPIIAMTDTNCDPKDIDYPIPANDDAARSIQYFIEKMADAVLLGLELREARVRVRGVEDSREKPSTEDKLTSRPADRRGRGGAPRGTKGTPTQNKAYVRKPEATEVAPVVETGTYSAPATVAPEGEGSAAAE